MVTALDDLHVSSTDIFSDAGLNFHAATEPRRCAVLVGLPSSRSDFIADYHRWPEQDFARSSAAYLDPESAWDNHGLVAAESLEKALDAARASGMHVFPAATIGDCGRAFSSEYDVVILITHWRGSRLVGRDLVAEPEDLLACVLASETGDVCAAAAEELRRRVSAALRDVPNNLSSLERRKDFAGALNNRVIVPPSEERLTNQFLLPGLIDIPAGEHLAIGDIWIETLHRDVLDICAAPAIIPGNKVELRDGLHSVAVLSAKVSNGWKGVADLTMCRSVILGHRLKDGRGDRGIIARAKTVDAVFALTVLKHLFRDIGHGNVNYAARYADLFAAAGKIIDEIV
jgi:hypothetical protein